MGARALLFLVAVLGRVVADEDIILPPTLTDPSLPERLMIFMPGGLVPNEYYKLTAQAIQKATSDVRLTVVIPEVFQKLCIITCPHKSACAPLKSRIDSAVSKSGFNSTNPKEDTFLAGHSLGATCANYLAQGYHYEFAGVLEFGGFVDLTGDASIENFSIPVLHMAGELDGGGARVSTMAGLYAQSKKYADEHGLEAALKLKPVQVLEGMDHSDFCPGFFVTKTKDCVSEVSREVALATIGKVAAAFLHLNSPVSEDTKKSAMETMKSMLDFTTEMVSPFLTAFQLEKGELQGQPEGVPAGPWCKVAQEEIVGLPASDVAKLKVEPCELITAGLHQFEHQHTNYTVLPDGSLEVSCFSDVEPPAMSISESQFSAKSVDCKMVDATRVEEQLHIETNTSVECADINRRAVEVAKKLLPAKSLKRHEAQGRGVCYLPDYTVPGNIGPLWVKSNVKMTETESCLQVASSKLVSTIKSPIFPGNHYCKLLSVSAAMDWMMTDSHKPFPYHGPTDQVEDVFTETIQI
eukprot:CAMPEP_0197655962 /NCGR_PEP_ID=MMETSP1338-20131121/39778_1 /TAXON_ID=43686 ORGANISM="Pelagodinium beii, Strain RCC1491" /NCGR_SAMPLE_ID=MMETSP1338 /ASSEMBLY_ACC=CAM_ASM_000754 /LENGTH=522 /DNA_ID=CAMNT_0043231729 /DNA_START=54 /DNA_END=1622 /DNA_ORIENTATION=+